MRTNKKQWRMDWDKLTNGETHEFKESEVSSFYNFRNQFWTQCAKRRITSAAVRRSGTGNPGDERFIICQAVKSGSVKWAKPSEMMFGIKR